MKPTLASRLYSSHSCLAVIPERLLEVARPQLSDQLQLGVGEELPFEASEPPFSAGARLGMAQAVKKLDREQLRRVLVPVLEPEAYFFEPCQKIHRPRRIAADNAMPAARYRARQGGRAWRHEHSSTRPFINDPLHALAAVLYLVEVERDLMG